MKAKTQKITAVICLVILLLTSLPLQAIATFITDMNSNAEFGVIEGSYSKYWHELHYVTYDGVTYIAFCCQRGIESPDGSEYVYNSDFVIKYKENLPAYEKIAEMIYFGYTMTYGTGLPTTDAGWSAVCCTQQYVWEYIHNYIDSSLDYPDRDRWNSSYMSSSIYAEWLEQTEYYYDLYHGNVSFNDTTTSATLGQSTTITDTEGRLSYYASFSQTVDGVTFSHTQGSNDLTITVSSDCTADTVTFDSKDYSLYQLLPNGSAYDSSTMSNYLYFQFSSGDVQNLIFSNYVDPSVFSISVEVEYGNTLLVKTNTNGDVLEGCTFGLYSDSNCTNLVRTGTSDSSGNIYFERLVPGTYYIKEINVPTGYLLDTIVQSVEVNVNETAEVSFANNEPTGEITLAKTDSDTGNDDRVDGTSHHGDATLDGTVYTLYANEDIYNVARTVQYFSANDEIATFTFDSYGQATINITNTSTSANLSIDGDTITGLPMGSYYVIETEVAEGYTQDTETHYLNLEYQDMNTQIITIDETLENIVQKGKFEVIKASSDDNTTEDIIEGAELTAILTKYVDFYGSFDEALLHLDEYADDEYAILTTDEDGYAISNELAYGNYTVNETYTPSTYIETIEEFYVTIDSDDCLYKYVENDLPFKSYIKLVKMDKDSGEEVTYSNTTFKLYYLNESNEWEEVSRKLGKTTYSEWTTDEDGIAWTETKLKAGIYKVDEIVLPTGFLELDEELTFEIATDNDTLYYDEDGDAYITVNVINEQPKGELIINKTINLRDDVDLSLVDIDFTEVEFTLTAAEDIIDYTDGEIIYSEGEVIGTYALNEDGTLTLGDLWMGSYTLQETKTLDGLVLDDTIYDVIFTQEDTITKVYTITEEIENETTLIEISKTDITGEEEIEGATLTVKDSEGNVIDTWISGTDTHKIEGLIVGETYTLVEEICVEEYVKASDIEFTIENTGEIQKVTMIDKVVEISKTNITGEEIEGATLQVIDTQGNIVDEWVSTTESHKVTGLEENQIYILHEEICVDGYVKASDIEFTVTTDKETQKITMIDKVLEIIKTDLVTGEELEGAELQVTDEDGNIIDEWTSTTEPHIISGLEEGKTYTLTEVTCPYGYELSESITFTVSYDKETQVVEMQDMPILKSVRVEKIDEATGEHITSNKFTFSIFADEECTELIEEVGANEDEGTALFSDLRYGTYYIKETKAPLGYKLSDQVVKIEINDEGVFADGVSLEENDGVYSFEYYNSLLPIIQTGNETNYILLGSLIVISLIGIVGGIILLRKKHKEK